MFESNHNLRHLPFFEELALKREGSAEWRAATAGLVVLRYIDNWLDEPPGSDGPDEWGRRNVVAAVEAVDDGSPLRAILSRVVDALECDQPGMRSVAGQLIAYGQALEYDAKWMLAADIYTTLLAHLHPTADSDSTITAHLRLAQCYRTLGQLDDAMETYRGAGAIGTAVGDLVGVLRGRVGEGNISMLRGNLPEAERILDSAIADASSPQLREVRTRALHERANLAHLREQYNLAIRFAYDALGGSRSATERDRILSDIAVSFLALGVYSAARDAYLVLSATAQEHYTRWAATLNLLEIATQTGVEPLFELYRRQLASQELPPYMKTAFHLGVGEGYRRFGDLVLAEQHVMAAIHTATFHGYNQYLFEAESALRQLRMPTPPNRVSTAVPLEVEEVAEAIRELRETVGASR